MFGRGVRRGVRPGHVSRDGTVVDDAPAARILRLHQFDGFLGAKECAGKVDGHHLHPLRVRQLLHRNGGCVRARIIEQNVEAVEGFPGLGEQRRDGIGIRDIGGKAVHLAAR